MDDFRNKLLGNDAYGFVVRVVGVMLAGALWFVSMRFSVSGFQIASEENAWVGWVLGLTVTYLQIVFNRGTTNKTLYLFGILAYVYGLATNLIGIMALRETALNMDMFMAEPFSVVLQLVIVIGLAMTVEILPEHLFILGVRDSDSDIDSDFVNSLTALPTVFGTRNPRQVQRGSKPNQNKQKNNQGHNQNKQKNNQPRNQHQGQGQGQGHQPRVVDQHEPRPREVYYPSNRE